MKSKKEFKYETNCISAMGEDINEMKSKAKEITYKNMLRYVGKPFLKLQHELGYDDPLSRVSKSRKPLKMRNDWAVSYWHSIYKGIECYYLRWSGIEYIFCLVDPTPLAVPVDPIGEAPLSQDEMKAIGEPDFVTYTAAEVEIWKQMAPQIPSQEQELPVNATQFLEYGVGGPELVRRGFGQRSGLHPKEHFADMTEKYQNMVIGAHITDAHIYFPGGMVEITKLDDGSRWVKLIVHQEHEMVPEEATHFGKVVDQRFTRTDGALALAPMAIFSQAALRIMPTKETP